MVLSVRQQQRVSFGVERPRGSLRSQSSGIDLLILFGKGVGKFLCNYFVAFLEMRSSFLRKVRMCFATWTFRPASLRGLYAVLVLMEATGGISGYFPSVSDIFYFRFRYPQRMLEGISTECNRFRIASTATKQWSGVLFALHWRRFRVGLFPGLRDLAKIAANTS